MGLFGSFFDLFQGKTTATVNLSVSSKELYEAAQEYQIRQLCFAVCVNMIANALARCEVRTFRGHEEIQEREYYLWNVEPNANQNSTAFWHKVAGSLCEKNEALLLSTHRKDGVEEVVVADDWQTPLHYPDRMNEYRGVRVGDMSYQQTFPEKKVLHLTLHHINVKPVIDGMYQSYYRLVDAAVTHYQRDHGQHWKVHVEQLAQGGENWARDFQKMIEDQVSPFLNSNGAILPEFDGYKYENVSGAGHSTTRDIREMINDIFDFTAKAFQIPAVLVQGQVSGAENATARFLGGCIDPICDQIQEEIIRKRYGYHRWSAGEFVRVDSSAIQHFDLFANAPNVEKLVGSGAFTINDVLRAANQPTINEPWANEHFLTKNIAALREAARSLNGQKGETTI